MIPFLTLHSGLAIKTLGLQKCNCMLDEAPQSDGGVLSEHSFCPLFVHVTVELFRNCAQLFELCLN